MNSKIKNVLILLIIALTFASCDNCPTGEPENLITLEEAIAMKKLNDEIQSNGAEDQYTDITFDLEDVQKYLHSMSQVGKEQGYDKLGLRVHYGAKIENGEPKFSLFLETVVPIDGPESIDPIILSKWKTMPRTSYYNMGDGGNNKVPTDTTDTPDPRKPKDPVDPKGGE